ncbi:hypothetical protein ABIB25_001344 [Nakamurella sp. UYEF19]|uniref:hypothetical protein n=1 Tax=Nakamurella sp. UYEF19 TaxID=1756392 RepID=UPI003397EC62
MTQMLDHDSAELGPGTRRPLRRRLVGPLATLVILAVLALSWLITGPMRTAGRLQDIVGIRWVLTSVSHDGRTAPVARLGDHTLKMESSGLISIFDGCNYNNGDWSWTMTGFEAEHIENGAVSCGYAPGTEPPPTDPIVTDGSRALYGSVSAETDFSTLTVGTDGYTLKYVRS